ncbi:CARDB domain-containing protein [Halorubrum depositum]|uniref:CARDB domain-containing protein n=1 Tax=Halorubrum depositum TaxID=2583992 RepID=UPI0011A7A3FD|nr:CARDB domain-containing protein [Halorubrum depositum]
MSTAHRTLTLALLLVAATTLIFTTGAAVIYSNADTVADGDLAVQSVDGPNGQYAYLNDDHEIAIDVSAANPDLPTDFEGLNVGSTGQIAGIFQITYTGEQYAHVWIEYDSENVSFVADGESIEGNESSVTLAPNETVTVGLAFDTRDATVGTRLGADEFSIEAKLAEPDDATEMDTADQQTSADGPTVTTTAPSADSREFTASEIDHGDSVRFRADGMALAGDDVTLEGIDLAGVRNERVELDAAGSPETFEGGSALRTSTTPRSMAYLALDHDFAPGAVDEMTIRFSADPDHLNATGTAPEDVTLYRQTDAGEWEEKPVEVVDGEVVDLSGLPEDRVHFRATTTEFSTFAVAAREPRFDVTEATVVPEAIDPGDEATVRATIENGGGAAGEQVVTLTADGDPVANETAALAPNETATVALGGTFETAGAYELAVDGTPVGTLIVGDPRGNGAGDEAGGSAAAGGFGDAGEPGDGPTEEPGAVDFVDLGGLLVALVVAVTGLALFRRVPRS